MRVSREISLGSSLHRASTDALIYSEVVLNIEGQKCTTIIGRWTFGTSNVSFTERFLLGVFFIGGSTLATQRVWHIHM